MVYITNNGVITNMDMSVKNFMYVKKTMFGIPLHVIVKMENIQQVLLIKLFVIKLQT